MAAGVGLAWGVVASRVCVASGKCRPDARHGDLSLRDVTGVVEEELIYRTVVSKEARGLAHRIGMKPLSQRTERGLMATQAVLFGAAHIDSGTSKAHQAVRFADAAAGGAFYGVLASKWGLPYSILAHLAHNIGTRF